MSELDEFKKRVEEFRKRLRESFEKLLESYEDSVKRIKEKAEEVPEGEVPRLYYEVEELRRRLRRELHRLYREFWRMTRELRRELRELALKLPRGYDKAVEEVRKAIIAIREDLESYRDLAMELAITLRKLEQGFKRSMRPIGIAVFGGEFNRLLRGLEEVLEEVFSSTGRIISKATEVISSVRIPESDARLIRLLVDAGIFKSRNDALAYFTHKGIEASKEWLERIQGRLEKIRELQEETRRELEDIFHREKKSEEE